MQTTIKVLFYCVMLLWIQFLFSIPKPVLISEIKLDREGYELSYRYSHRGAQWVYECLTEKSLEREINRGNTPFQEDPQIPSLFRANPSDYVKCGFDRGHLCPAADSMYSETSMKDSFLLSNVCPQHPGLNRGYWRKLEKHVRDLTKEYKTLHVFTGPLFLPCRESDGKLYVKYQVIGETEIAVPTHYFKLILKESGDFLSGFIVPNQPQSDIPLDRYQTTLEKVEKAAGFVLKIQE